MSHKYKSYIFISSILFIVCGYHLLITTCLASDLTEKVGTATLEQKLQSSADKDANYATLTISVILPGKGDSWFSINNVANENCWDSRLQSGKFTNIHAGMNTKTVRLPLLAKNLPTSEYYRIRIISLVKPESYKPVQDNFYDGRDLYFFLSRPFQFVEKETIVNVGTLSERKLIGYKRYRILNRKGQSYAALPIEVVMTDVMAPFDIKTSDRFSNTASLKTDANGEFSIPVYAGMNYSMAAKFGDCLDSKTPYVIAGKEIDGVKCYGGCRSDRVPLATLAAAEFAKNKSRDKIQTVAINLGRLLIVRVYENVNGQKVPSEKVGAVLFKKNPASHFIDYAIVKSGMGILKLSDKLCEPNPGHVVFNFNHMASPLYTERDFVFDKTAFAFSGKDELTEIEFLLLPRFVTKLKVSGEDGKENPDARLYFPALEEEASGHDKPVFFRSGDEITLKPGRHRAVLHAPGCEVEDFTLEIKDADQKREIALQTRPAPKVKINFSADGFSGGGKGIVHAAYDAYPFIPPARFPPFAIANGKGVAEIPLDVRHPLLVAVNDMTPDMRFPGAVARHNGKGDTREITVKAPAPVAYAGKLPTDVASKLDAEHPATMVWAVDVPGRKSFPIACVATSANGTFAARLAPGVKYHRFLCLVNPGRLTPEQIREQITKKHQDPNQCHRLQDYPAPSADGQAEPEAIAIGDKIAVSEAFLLIRGWDF